MKITGQLEAQATRGRSNSVAGLIAGRSGGGLKNTFFDSSGLSRRGQIPRSELTGRIPRSESLDRAQRAQRRQSPLVLVEAVVTQHAALQPDQTQALYKARLKRVSSRPAWGLLV